MCLDLDARNRPYLAKHPETDLSDLLVKQEHEADVWAINWMLAKIGQTLKREFRVLSAISGLAWIGLIDAVRGKGSTHPLAPQRLGKCSQYFLVDEVSPALEIGTYILKAFFDPHTAVAESEHPADAFSEILFSYTRIAQT